MNLSESYRKRFNFQEFLKLEFPWKQREYLESIGLLVLGEGFSRKTYALSSKKVIKVVLGNTGVIQNMNEYKIYQKIDSKFVPKIYEHDPKFRWLMAELVRPMTSTEYASYVGVRYPNLFPLMLDMYTSGKSLDQLKFFYEDKNKDVTQWDVTRMRILELSDFIQETDLHPREFTWDNMGFGADGRVVLLDSGYDKEGF